MTKYCLLFCVVFLAIGVSCDHVKEQFGIGARDESVTSDGEAGRPAAPGEQVHAAGGTVTEHVAFKPIVGDAAERKYAEPMPPVEAQAVELAAKELAINLRLLEEDDADKRAELEQEMVSLREQRRSLYETRVEGK